MGFFRRFAELFMGRRKPTLKELPLDDLKREQITLQGELRKLEIEGERIEREEEQLGDEYRAAHQSGRETTKRSVAQKMQNLRMRRKGIETRLSYTSKMFQTVMGMLIIKENMNFFEKLGVGSVISNMDLGELENYVTEATIEGTLHQEKLVAMLRGVNEGVDQLDEATRDGTFEHFMDELDAELLGSGAAETATNDRENAVGSASMDTVIAHGLNVARETQRRTEPQSEPKNTERE